MFRDGHEELKLAMRIPPHASGSQLCRKKEHVRDGCAALDGASRKLCGAVRGSVAAGAGSHARNVMGVSLGVLLTVLDADLMVA